MKLMESIRNKHGEKKVSAVIFLFVMLVIECILIWKAKYGYGGNDESFYLTTAHRLAKGDSLLSQEWHLAQMSSLLIYPFMKLYLAFAGTTEGILLSFRYIYILVKTVAAVAMYVLLQKKYRYYAIAAVAAFMLFTPYNLLQICYNSMGLMGLLFAGVLLITTNCEGKYWKLRIICAGLSLAAAVLCCPYLVFVYVLIVAGCIVLRCWKKDICYTETALYITLGCAILAVTFFAFVLSRAGISEILENLPEMMKDPAHPVRGVADSLLKLVVSMAQFFPVSTILFVAEVMLITTDGLWTRRKYHRKGLTYERIYYYLSGFGVIVTLVLLIQQTVFYYNLIMVPMVYMGALLIYTYCWNGRLKEMEKGPMIIWAFGVIYGTLLSMSSDNGLTIASSGMAVATFAAILLMGADTKQSKQKSRTICSVIVLTVLFGALVYSVTHNAFWEEDVASLDVTIEEGPLKNVVTSEKHAEEYYNTIEDLKWFKNKEEGNFVYFSEKPYTYLYVDMPYGTHSGSSGDFVTHYTLDIPYFELHPEKVPNYIYIEKQYIAGEDVSCAAENYGYKLTELKCGYVLEKE